MLFLITDAEYMAKNTYHMSETFFSIRDRSRRIEEIQIFPICPIANLGIRFCNTLVIKKYHVLCKYSKFVVKKKSGELKSDNLTGQFTGLVLPIQ